MGCFGDDQAVNTTATFSTPGTYVLRLAVSDSLLTGFDDLTLPQWREHSPLFDDDVRSVITPLRSIEKKHTPQSTAPKAVAAALADTRAWLRQLELE